MGAYVVLREGEDLESALRRFQRFCKRDQARSWTKRRYGYYEKPSELRRKRKRLRKLNARGRSRAGEAVSWKPRISLEEQFRRTGPTNAVGH